MIKYGKIKVDSIGDSFKDGLQQAQLRQVVVRELPKARTGNSIKDSLFSTEELGIENNVYEEVRVAWQEVKKGITKEEVQAKVNSFPNAKLRRFLASSPILSDDQELVIKNGLTGAALESFNEKYNIPAGTVWDNEHVKHFVNNIASRQVVKDTITNEIVMFNGKYQFRRIELSVEGLEDLDARTTTEVKSIEDIELSLTAKGEALKAKAEVVEPEMEAVEETVVVKSK